MEQEVAESYSMMFKLPKSQEQVTKALEETHEVKRYGSYAENGQSESGNWGGHLQVRRRHESG